jgi:hypothetical protein
VSEENVEIYRRLCEEFLESSREHDWEPWLARIGSVLDPEVIWDASGLQVPDLRGVHRGSEAVIRWWREWLAAWETSEFDYELVDAGDQVVLLLTQTMRGRSTGIEVALGEYAHVAALRDGLITHWRAYASQQEALAAAGVRR